MHLAKSVSVHVNVRLVGKDMSSNRQGNRQTAFEQILAYKHYL